MTELSKSERTLASLVLSLFLVLQAPFAGLLTVSAAAQGSDGLLVICTGDGFKQVAHPAGTAQPENIHDCLCPPGNLCSGGAALDTLVGVTHQIQLPSFEQPAPVNDLQIKPRGIWRNGTARSPPQQFI